MLLTAAYIDGLALNSAAIKNGQDLVKKNSFTALCRVEDASLIFGDCKGSGKEPYRCSVDFIHADNPVFRCTCPSRQFPCKHILGLMYAQAAGKHFELAGIPTDIIEKREKADRREEKKNESPAEEAPKRKTNKSAQIKKFAAQLEGVNLLDKLIRQMVQNGLGSLDKKTLQMMEEQAKQLGNYYVLGIQTAFRELLILLRNESDREQIYSTGIEKITALYALVKKSREYLISRIENPDLVDITTTIEERIGHAWQLAELRDQGLIQTDVELAQLAFRSYSDPARNEFIDEGYWINLSTGAIHITRTYRPFKAAKYIKEEDSIFSIVKAKELFIYPGEMNARVRYEESLIREVANEDYASIKLKAQTIYQETIKAVKNQIKNPLSDKHPVILLKYSRLLKAGELYVIEDEQGKQISLGEINYLNYATTQLLPLLKSEHLLNQVILVMFEHNSESGRLLAQPLSLITEHEVIRFLY